MLGEKQIETPFKPNVSGPRDLRFFDKIFTEETAEDSMPDVNFNSAQKEANKYAGFTFGEPSHL